MERGQLRQNKRYREDGLSRSILLNHQIKGEQGDRLARRIDAVLAAGRDCPSLFERGFGRVGRLATGPLSARGLDRCQNTGKGQDQ